MLERNPKMIEDTVRVLLAEIPLFPQETTKLGNVSILDF